MGLRAGPEDASLSARARPQYHYFYGSTDNTDDTAEGTTEQEQDSLIGEELLPTDQEGDTPNSSEQDLQHLIITNGNGGNKAWFSSNARHANSIGLGRALVIVGLATAMGFLLVLLFPHTSDPVPQVQAPFIPFPPVDRSDYGDPVADFIRLDRFHPNLFSPSEPRQFIFPFPTGAFWTNFVVESPDPVFSYPVAVYPYAYKWSDSSLQVSYPANHRHTDSHSIRDTFAPDLSFSSKEQILDRCVTRFDPVSVTLRFSSKGQSKWESVLVQGSPYITLKYLDATPTIKALSIFKSVQCPGDDDDNFSDLLDDDDEIQGDGRKLFGVCSIVDDSARDTTLVRGVQFIFKTNEGVSWFMFSSEPIDLIFDKIRKTTVWSSSKFTGIIRLALIPSSDDSLQIASSTGLRRLIYHAGVYPIGGDVAWEVRTITSAKKAAGDANATSRVATVKFSYTTRTMTDNSLRPNAASTGLLMLGLPHHSQVVSRTFLLSKKQFDLTYRCVKGTMRPVVGAAWWYDEPLPEIGFDGPLQKRDPRVHQKILDQVGEDLTRVLPTRAENIYGFGKQVARLAQLAHITSRLRPEKDPSEESNGLFQQATSLLWYYLEMLFSGEVSDALLFDSNLGGLVSTNGLYDKGEDFGNGRYNDHHFHYGYILYACAIMARINSTFIDRFGPHVDAIFYDVAHNANGDARPTPSSTVFFPLARHKSWFDGHSFATGMFSFGNGKSQESSSEAVNCYYGAYLWSLVRHSDAPTSEITDFTRVLLAMEIRSVKTYWHMIPPESKNSTISSNVYNDEFKANFMVGNVGMLDVECNTWFGSDPLYVHMINVLPITAVTTALFNSTYVSKEYPYLMASRSEVEMAWRGYVVSMHAIIDPSSAWKAADTIVSYESDSALSKSQVLYWISGQLGFNASTFYGNDTSIPASDAPATNSTNSSNSVSATCESREDCRLKGLSGLCCPTDSGIFLNCCS